MTKPPANATMITGEAQFTIKNQGNSLTFLYFLGAFELVIARAIKPTR